MLVELGFKKKAYIGGAFLNTIPYDVSPIESYPMLRRLERKYKHKAPSLSKYKEIGEKLDPHMKSLHYTRGLQHSQYTGAVEGPGPISSVMAHEVGHELGDKKGVFPGERGDIFGKGRKPRTLLKSEYLASKEGQKILGKPSLRLLLSPETYREEARLAPAGDHLISKKLPKKETMASQLYSYLQNPLQETRTDPIPWFASQREGRILEAADKLTGVEKSPEVRNYGTRAYVKQIFKIDERLDRNIKVTSRRGDKILLKNREKLRQQLANMPEHLVPEYQRQKGLLSKRVSGVFGPEAEQMLSGYIKRLEPASGIEKVSPVLKGSTKGRGFWNLFKRIRKV